MKAMEMKMNNVIPSTHASTLEPERSVWRKESNASNGCIKLTKVVNLQM